MIRKQMNYLLVFFFILAFIAGCDDFKSETINLDPADQAAVNIFENNLVRDLSTTVFEDSLINIRSTEELIDSLLGIAKTVAGSDSVFRLVVTRDSYDTYLVFRSKAAGDVYFFFKDFIKMHLVGASGDTLALMDDTMPYKTITGYYKVTLNDVTPLIKARYCYEVEGNVSYLFKIIATDQTRYRTFDLAIVQE